MIEKIQRHKYIMNLLEGSSVPVKGQFLADETGVSRQMIVKDIDELRKKGSSIVATTRGYLLSKRRTFRMVVSVKHDEEEIYDELWEIIKAGGHVVDVSVIHAVYGELKGKLDLSTIDDLNRFIAALKASNAVPLLSLSKDGVHLHTIEADSQESLERIRSILKRKGYLLT
ncbi:MAG: transcription repressor NadR [Kosmotogaceae bacterium]|nr:transcription repressor NadR [Kosmotogaceae bacterium]